MSQPAMTEQMTLTEEPPTHRAGSPVDGKKIWIDLDNTPHIPFFAPIIQELESRGFEIFLTARDAYQVTEMVDLYRMDCIRVGKHLGKNKILKVLGVCDRTARLLPLLMREKPALALSHGSRAQTLGAYTLGIPSVVILDYEFAHQGLLWVKPTWVMCPEVIPAESIKQDKNHTLRYRGIKEDVYAPYFQADPATRSKMGVSESELLITIRPPATEAHYHRPESDVLYAGVVEFLGNVPNARLVVLPRNARQAGEVRKSWSGLIDSGRMIVPEHAVDGMNLIWYSDLVVSGGGTMNREAAALGVPVYSIFRGKIGSVDRYLSEQGRLVLLENVDDAKKKLKLVRRERVGEPSHLKRFALDDIIQNVTKILRNDVR